MELVQKMERLFEVLISVLFSKLFILLPNNAWIFLSPFNSYIMEKVDLVLVGAEGVVESGGIINKVIVTFSHHSINSGLLQFGFSEAFKAF